MRRLVPLAVVLLLAACATPTPTPAPSLAPGQRVTVAPLPTSTAPAGGVPLARATFAAVLTPTTGPDVASGGLGLRRADWEAAQRFNTLQRAEYRDDRVVAIEEPAGRFNLTTDLEATRRRVVQSLGPTDAAYLGTENRGGTVVDRFASASLGPFTAAYTLIEGRVVSYRIALGNQ